MNGRLVAAALVTASGLVLSPAASGELPPATLSSTTLHLGDTITFSGTGCLDPATSSSSGLEATFYIPSDHGRGGISPRPLGSTAVAADGSFEGSVTVDQPLFPVGAQTGFVVCERPTTNPDELPTAIDSTTVAIDVVPPSLPNVTITLGEPVTYDIPCDIVGGEYGGFGIAFETPKGTANLHIGGKYPYSESAKAGDTVTLEVLGDPPVGTYEATAECSVSEAGVSAYYQGFTVTVAPAPPTPKGTDTPPTEPPATAPAASPVAKSPNYTG